VAAAAYATYVANAWRTYGEPPSPRDERDELLDQFIPAYDVVEHHESMFITETRAVATDPVARARFRRYWALVSPGVSTIRWLSLRPLKREAERRALTQQAG